MGNVWIDDLTGICKYKSSASLSIVTDEFRQDLEHSFLCPTSILVLMKAEICREYL